MSKVGHCRPLGLCLVLLLFLVFVPLVRADMGMVPWPPPVSLRETGQKAIVAWNGTEEVLILSIDVESSESATVLRILPLPSNPTKVEEGTFSSFENIVRIINQKIRALGQYEGPPAMGPGEDGGVPGIVITFHAELGPHDVTIVKVNDLEFFTAWVENFVSSKGLTARAIPDGFTQSVAGYLENEIAYFVFDVIQTGPDEKSITPLIYRFETDFLYYPLNITGNSVGLESTLDEIQLFIITKGRISSKTVENVQLLANIGFEEWLELSVEELAQISPEIADLFESDPFVANASYSGRLLDLQEDLIISRGEVHVPSSFERFLHDVSNYLDRNYLYRFLKTAWAEAFTVSGILILPLLGILFCGAPATAVLIARLIKSSAKRFARRKFIPGILACLIVFLLIWFSSVEVIAIIAWLTFFVTGIAAGIIVVKRLILHLLAR